MPRSIVSLALAAMTVGGLACSRALRNVSAPGPRPGVEALWQRPASLSARNLRHGPGGARLTPGEGTYTFIAEDATGFSAGFDVKDGNGLEWSVKLGPEAQSEVAASRILWAAGFHQPPTYYVERWTLVGTQSGRQPAGRFRPTLPDEEVVGDWSWYENPFVGTRPFGGLVVLNLMITNWDWKTSNNKIYRDSDGDGVPRRYVVRDLGAAFGRFTYPTLLQWSRLRGFGQGTRNDVEGFERQGFIRGVRPDGRVEFDYRGIYGDLVNSVRVEDVVWASELLSRLSDAQWRDAFAAAAYTPEQTERFVAKLKSKVADGLALRRSPLRRALQ